MHQEVKKLATKVENLNLFLEATYSKSGTEASKLSLTSTCIIEHVCAYMDKHAHVNKLKCLKIIKCISSGVIRFHQWFP